MSTKQVTQCDWDDSIQENEGVIQMFKIWIDHGILSVCTFETFSDVATEEESIKDACFEHVQDFFRSFIETGQLEPDATSSSRV